MQRTATDGDPVHDALAQHYDQFAVEERLHAVPPHETYAVTVDGRRAVCKRATGPRGDPATEAAVLRYVADETPLPVPEVLAVGDDHFVAAWCGGLSEGGEDEATARAIGAAMARLHAATADAVEGYGPVAATTADGEMTVDAHRDWVGALRTRLLERRTYLATVGHADVADAVVEWLERAPAVLADPGPPVLCHGNLLPDHVAVDEGVVTCAIDVEHALVGPPEYDCWRSLIPIQSGDGGDARGAAFREGYASVRALPDGLDDRGSLYFCLLAVEYLKALYLQDQHDAETTAEKAVAYREYVFEHLEDLDEGV